MKREEKVGIFALPSAKDFIQQNSDQYLHLDFRRLKEAISTKCLLPDKPKELIQLKNWVKDERRRLKNHPPLANVEGQKFLKNQDTKEQADQIFTEQEDYILSGILTLEDKKKDDFLRLLIDENFLLFLKFLKSRSNAPNNDFLPRLLNLCCEIQDPTKRTLLFIRICALHQREDLKVKSELIGATLVELSQGAVDQDGAHGLLRISFQNQIAFNNFPIESLLAFQDRYSLQFKRFFSSLNDKIESQVLKCIPATCFLFTKPFFFELQNQGKNLYQNMEYSCLPSIIKLLAYSFESDKTVFTDLLILLKGGCLQIFGKGFDLAVLLDSITELEILRDKTFFGSLKNQFKLLQHVFKLIAEHRITTISDDLIEELLKMEEKSYLEAEQAPRVVGDSIEDEKKYQTYCLLLRERNKLTVLDNIIDHQLGQDVCQLLKLFKIKSFSYIQKAAWVAVGHFFEQEFGKVSLKFETGAGKTTLGLLFLLYQGRNNVKSFYVNNSIDLCFRDYNKLAPIAQQLGLRVSYIVQVEDIAKEKIDSDIFFVQTSTYYELTTRQEWKDVIVGSFLLLDEFDETLFAEKVTKNNMASFTLSRWLVAVTGSSLAKIHKNILKQGLQTAVLEFPSSQTLDGKENHCKEQTIFSSRKGQVKRIVEICSDLVAKTPVLLILEKEGHKAFLEQAKKLRIRDLTKMKPEELETFLNGGFLMKQEIKGNEEGCYYTCLLNETQGRGLDAPTNSTIESHGGIATIIAKIPDSYQQFDQFKGRTKRLSNKGVHYVVLWKNGVKETCQEFLTFHLGSAEKIEFLRLNNLLNEIIVHNNEQSQEKNKDGLKDVVMTSENVMDESENSGEESDDFEDEDDDDYVEKSVTIQKSKEECKSCGKGYDKNHICQKLTPRKQQDPLKNVKTTTLGKRKRVHNKPRTTQQFSTNKRMQKQADKMMNTSVKPEKDNKHPLGEERAYIRVNEAPKVVIRNKEFQEFNECLNNQDPLNVNQEQKEFMGGSQQSKTKRQQTIAMQKSNPTHKTQKEMIDEGYFAGYSESSIHKDMVNDLVRVEQYTKAINQTCKDKVVLDLGCGTGVLSVLAIKAGAKKVYAVDNADIEKFMSSEFKQFIKDGSIEFIKGTIEELASAEEDNLRIPKVDVVLSEWMGYFLVFENMICSYMIAIKTFLNPVGIVVPSHAMMYLNAAMFNLEDKKIAKKYLQGKQYKSALIEQCQADYILSNPTSIKTLDFSDRSLQNPLENDGFISDFQIQINKSGTFNAFIGSFEVKLCEGVFLNTMSISPVTHWKQSIFFVAKSIQVEINDVIQGKIHVRVQEENHRNLMVNITYKVQGKNCSECEELFTFE